MSIVRPTSRMRYRLSVATLHVYYAFHKLNSERLLQELLNINPVQT